MDFFDSAYNYVISAVVGMLVTLCATLKAQRVPQGSKYASYNKSRALLIYLFSIIAVDLVLSLAVYRLEALPHADTIVDILCYTPVALLFLLLTQTLMEYKPESRTAIGVFIAIWILLVAVGIANESLYICDMIDTDANKTVFAADAAVWVILILSIALCIAITFRKAKRKLSNFYSDDVARRVEWLRKSFIIFLIWGLASPIAAIGPSWLNTIYAGLGSAVYLYLCISFLNYNSVYVRQKANDTDETVPDSGHHAPRANTPPSPDAVKEWEDRKGFRTPGVTIEMMADSLSMSANTLASIINEQHNCSFCDYVTNLRIRDAQTLLVHHADKDIKEIAAKTGFSSEEEMERAFKQTVYISPAEWRKGVLSLIN